MDLYPLTFEPIYQERIWGGRNIARLFARRLPKSKPIGESWELADLPEGTSVVANGPLAGKTLTELTRELGPALLGKARPTAQGRFPLLLKYLDAADTLSLQVHPDEAAAARIGYGAVAKTECWYVIESRGGFIYKGLRPRVTAERFRQAVQANECEKVLRRYEVKAGDFHYIPAGTPHALGAGVMVAEVQTPSDTTYRVTDWGRGRQTHLEQAMQSIHFGARLPRGTRSEAKTLLRSESFTVRRYTGDKPIRKPAGNCAAMMYVRGRRPIQVGYGIGGSPRTEAVSLMEIAPGRTVLLPAGIDAAICPATSSALLLIGCR